MPDGVDAAAIVSIAGVGDVTVPLSANEFDGVMHGMADDDGWDVGFVVIGLEERLTSPTLVGVVIRVPGVADPMEAVTVAQRSFIDNNPLPQGAARTVRCMVQSYDAFGEEEA